MSAAEGGGTAKAEERRRHKSTDPITGVEKLSRPLTLKQFTNTHLTRTEAPLAHTRNVPEGRPANMKREMR